MRSLLLLAAVCLLPAVAAAGPVQFDLTGTKLDFGWAGAAVLQSLTLAQQPGPAYSFDPVANTPVAIPVVEYDPARLGAPARIDLDPYGTTHWNGEGYFAATVRLTDRASGDSGEVTLEGRAHTFAHYADGRWGGGTAFWFDDSRELLLGGTKYTVRGTNMYDSDGGTLNGPDYASVAVWAGGSPPALSPEPGTLLLAAAGLLPAAGLARRRRPTSP